jgi:2'-5' RNA ligase
MRLFFALQLPDEVRKRIATFAPKADHFTLAFLGETDKLDDAIAAGQAVRASPFELAISGSGAFPNMRRPHVIWLGVSEGKDPLCAVANQLCAALRERGFGLEGRPFRPHLTVGRVKPGGEKEARRTLERIPAGELARFTAREFMLMQSELGPKGAKHTALRAFHFD